MSSAPRLNSLFRIQTILILDAKEGISGYELAKALEKQTGKKPSSGKIYPFLHQLQDNNLIEEIEEEDDTDRAKKVYRLTKEGSKLVDELLDRMGNILDARLEEMLDLCKSCGVKIYDTEVVGTDEKGHRTLFCCTHCKSNYEKNLDKVLGK